MLILTVEHATTTFPTDRYVTQTYTLNTDTGHLRGERPFIGRQIDR